MENNNERKFEDKIIIVTDANTGIGFETALNLAKRGATIILACRDRVRAQTALEKIIEATKSQKVFFEELALNDLSSVKDFARRFQAKYNHLDILINNAGIGACPYGKTKDGFENQIGVNHLGHFLLTNLLLELLKKSAPSRIINVSSALHKRGTIRWDDLNWEKEYSPFGAYNQSKLANVLFTVELASRLKGTNVSVVSLHPGAVDTEIDRNFSCLLSCCWKCFPKITPEEGAKTTIYCAVSPDIPNKSGCYFDNSKVEQLSSKASNADDAKRLWAMSSKLVNFE